MLCPQSSSYELKCVPLDKAKLRHHWERPVDDAINLSADGYYPFPRNNGWILFDLMGWRSYIVSAAGTLNALPYRHGRAIRPSKN